MSLRTWWNRNFWGDSTGYGVTKSQRGDRQSFYLVVAFSAVIGAALLFIVLWLAGAFT